MRRVLWVLSILPVQGFSQFQQYVDTIQGRITVKYNNPVRMKVSVLAGGAFETQTIGGSVMIPSLFADVHVRPVRWASFHGALTEQVQMGWQYQKIKNTRNVEFGARLFLKKTIIEKFKTFTATSHAWKYDFEFPVKVLWNMGISGSYRYGTSVFNSGTDPNTSVRFLNHENHQLEFLDRAAVPYTFSEISGGFVVNTSTAMKVNANLPGGKIRTKRMKTFTEFRVEAVYANHLQYANQISRRLESDEANFVNYDVVLGRVDKWGFKMQGIFRRRWIGFKIEAGVRPGLHYRFSENQRNSALIDRTYLMFGVGLGWM